MATNLKASGELTIVDISDSKQLTSLISTLLQRQVIFDPNDETYSPNYASRNNILVPQLFITGNMEDIITDAKSVNWYYQVNSIGTKIPITGNTTDYTLDTTTKQLTIKTNVLQSNISMSYTAEIVYTDQNTGMDVKTISEIELLKITNGTNGVNGDAPVVAVLSNDSHVIPSNSDGEGMNYFGATTEFHVYEGVEDITALWATTSSSSDGIIGSLRNLGTVSLSSNMYDKTTAKNTYLYYGAEQTSNEEDWTSDYITISINTDYLYKQLYTNRLSYSATPYTTFTYFDKDYNYLYQEVREEDGIATGESKEFSYNIKTSVAEVKHARVGGNLMLDGAFFAEYFSTGIPDSRVIYDVTGMTVDVGYVDFISTRSSQTLTKRFTLTKARRGSAGVDGKTPIYGTDYFDGTDGQDGKSSYIWIMYSQNSDGSSMVSTPSNAKYIGISTTQTNIRPTSNANYSWTLIKGTDGIEGESGVNGESSYLHIKYSNDGTGFTANNGEELGSWIGIYVDDIQLDSSTASKYTWSKVKGEDATAYWLSGYPTAIKKNGLNVYTPLNFSVTIISQKGIETPSAYSGRFIIQETTDGTTWVTKYTSSTNELTKNFTPSSGIKAVKIKSYLAGGVSSLIDEQTIPVVEDGSDPVIAILSTPLGTIIKNSTGNLTIEANLYKGGTTVTPASYKWYELDTNVSGGWRQLTSSYADGTSGYTTKTLTVTGVSIVSLSTYKVEAIYNGISYSDMVTLSDLSDPISTVLIGSGIYKNGQGTNTQTARLYRNGKEIDVNGTIYKYQWSLLNKDGDLNSSFTATGKTITIPASAFEDTSLLQCDVDDNK